MRFTLDVAGDIQVDRELEAFGQHAASIDNVLRDIGRDLNREAARQFDSEGRYASGGWPALTQAYRKRKAAMVARGKIINGRPARYMQILRLTDRMRRSLVNRSDAEHIERVRNNTLEWGTKVPYLRFHQAPGPSSDAMPRRRVIDLSERKRQSYLRAILTYLRTGRSGL